MQKLILFLNHNGMTLAEGYVGRQILSFGPYLFIAKKLFLYDVFSKSSWGFSWRIGLYRHVSIGVKGKGRLNHLAKQIMIPSLIFLPGWGKIVIPKKNPILHYDLIDESLPLDQRPPSVVERELSGEKAQKRIEFLTKNYLKHLETKGVSQLFKHPVTEKFWQSVQLENGQLYLAEVTPHQWSYDFLERKFGLFEEEEELDFYHALEEGPRHFKCSVEDCSQIRVKNSSLCRDHHFEAVKGHPYDENRI